MLFIVRVNPTSAVKVSGLISVVLFETLCKDYMFIAAMDLGVASTLDDSIRSGVIESVGRWEIEVLCRCPKPACTAMRVCRLTYEAGIAD